MNRIDERFALLRQRRQKAIAVFIGAGDPHLEATHQLALAFDRGGVDILELGVPFSDPLADGPVNQLAAQRGLASGTTPGRVLETVRQIRRTSSLPIVLYIYYNLVHRRGLDRFVQDAASSGVDGLLILDLPPEEAEDYQQLMQWSQLSPIYLVAPTTPEARMDQIVQRGSGFIYYVSREGVTGMQNRIADSIGDMTAKLRQRTQTPILVGFGISNPEQAKAVARFGDGVVVGSAIVNQIAEHGDKSDLVARVSGYVLPLVEAVKSVPAEPVTA